MTGRNYLQILKSEIIWVLAVTVIFALGGWWYSARQPIQYQTSVSFVVSQQPESRSANASYYQYDRYYLGQAVGLVADNISSFLSLPSQVEKIYQKAGLDLPTRSVKKLAALIKVHRSSLTANSLNVTLTANDGEGSQKLAQAVQQVIVDGFQKDILKIETTTTTVPAAVMPNTVFNITLAALAGLLVGIVMGFGRYYLR